MFAVWKAGNHAEPHTNAGSFRFRLIVSKNNYLEFPMMLAT